MKTRAFTLMIQGTTSDAGKSAIVTGLCRALYRRGVKVAPFKPQNMALNSAVTVDGGEIGRAQAAQAQACCLEPHTDMNPVLLKPNSDTGSQIIIQGKAVADMDARNYHRFKPQAMKAVLESHARLAEQYDVIVVEGAGSPAEINLRDNDIANMGFAEAIDCPVVLIADIERGGVFAQLYGTLALLSKSEQARISGMVINRFRGDLSILKPGIDWLENKTKKTVYGTLPYLHKLYLEAEDSLNRQSAPRQDAKLNIIIPALPKLSNHTDFDPLTLHPDIHLEFIEAGQEPPPADLIILPGSKSVQADLKWLVEQGWPEKINRHLRYGGKLLGVCGGLQMLGTTLTDPHCTEGPETRIQGLGLLDYQTTYYREKQLNRVSGSITLNGENITGYEIHTGITEGPALDKPFAKLGTRNDGAISDDQQIIATYLHGLFDHPEAFRALTQWAGLTDSTTTVDHREENEHAIDRLADIIEQHTCLLSCFDLTSV